MTQYKKLEAPLDGLSYDQLSAWYKRHGFKERGGMHKWKPKKG